MLSYLSPALSHVRFSLSFISVSQMHCYIMFLWQKWASQVDLMSLFLSIFFQFDGISSVHMERTKVMMGTLISMAGPNRTGQ